MAKRIADAIAASAGLIVLSPVLLVCAVGIRVTMGAPVLFRQERHGLQGRPFVLLKFRTMSSATDHEGQLLPDHERLTRLGRFMRSTSIDELPELVNILRGEMSLVGPRPLLPRYTAYFTPKELRRFEARPGLTGLAQVNGRNEASWDDRLSHDVAYVDGWNIFLDARILARTVQVALTRSGFAADPRGQMLDLDVERGIGAPQ
ncbi:sugar transferase [Georgenia sp. Marseille-Q6866]